jgi:propionyl-CoA carboxylase alpha chain
MAPSRLQRVLVANRGEIARRVIRGAHDVGMEAVAVYTAEDATSPYVGEADLSAHMTGNTLAETYLNPGALVALADFTGADSIHPGYGFLSENPAFPEACSRAGIVWVGPTADSMRVMGHKVRAKETVAAAGVPVLPSVVVAGTISDAELARSAGAIGFPLLVKASAGGGGRGMRLVDRADELGEAVAAARREAAAAFGSDEVFLERYLPSPRHVEVQVVGDTTGTVLHLYDRECSVQRRHQKVIEEAPAILVDRGTRARMWHAAAVAARSVGYLGVGTVEFLVDGSEFYFLEMNTRLQVEHGVTELVTGLDLVALQLLVASGQPLPLAQQNVTVSGHAVEARLCAERPREGYRPTPGTARHVAWPEGSGLRTDAAIESGSTVSPSFDSLVAKVMAHADGREAAIGRLGRAVAALEVDGLETNRDLLAAILHDEVFRHGDAGIDYLDGRDDLRDATPPDEVRHRHAAAAALALLHRRAAASLVPVPAAGWRNVGAAHHVDTLADATGTVDIRTRGPADAVAVRVGGAWEDIGVAATSDEFVDLASGAIRRRYRVRLALPHVEVNGPEGQSSFVLRTEDDADEQGGTAGECRAPLPGTIARVMVSVGDVVEDGDGLVVLEAMKMEHTLRSGGAGTVTQVLCAPGGQVDVGDVLVVVEPA